MARRRGLWLAVAVGAGVTLLVLGRPGGDEPPPAADTARPVESARPAGPAPPGAGGTVGAPPAGTVAPTSAPGGNSPAPVPVLPHAESGVVGDEALDPAGAAAAVAAAEEFAAAWSVPDRDWHSRLADLATAALADSLAQANPPQPAPVVTGDGRLLFDTLAWARVAVPTDRGILVLDLVARADRWLVTGVDWRSE